MNQSAHGSGRPPAGRLLHSLWHSLVALGSLYCGPLVHQEATAAARSGDTAGAFAPGATPPAPPRGAGPPPGHPERLREDLPLSGTERLLARELWPARDGGHEAPDTG
ncbi:DUF6059 family protein [Streptomyces fructofermentans]|uniref:DUF6059 family protein n=1 Tax=Streptomyces fructofermentans TaxID=152141 RepID=UPI0033FCF2FF